uniref:Uncharacterized protein n=1 Tax=Panagrolaimus sp. JU765 TaxID=591449 RepID=A0AC34QTN9_9BILA
MFFCVVVAAANPDLDYDEMSYAIPVKSSSFIVPRPLMPSAYNRVNTHNDNKSEHVPQPIPPPKANIPQNKSTPDQPIEGNGIPQNIPTPSLKRSH